MKLIFKTAAIVAALTSGGLADEPLPQIDFRNDIIPLLTKHGCNAGACHGAAIGRGSFKLSLYGGDPTSDYDEIVREVSGRRVNLARPEESLIFRKPAEYVQHGGGTIFYDDSESAQVLLDWIRQGVPHSSSRQLVRVEIVPTRHVALSTGKAIPLRATAHYSDGSQQDVTRWTIFAAEDPSAVEITESSIEPSDGREVARVQQAAKVRREGRHIVVARFSTEVVPIELIVARAKTETSLADKSQNNFIDVEVVNTLETLGLQPSPGIGDAAYLRRITLDLTGRLPSDQRVAEFLADEEPNKRQSLIAELLQSDAYTAYWTGQLAQLLKINTRDQKNSGNRDPEATKVYYEWLNAQVRDDASYRQIARALITATGDTHQIGPANFYRTTRGPREQAEFFSELFMGSRLRCANCHNHPLDRWTQDDYHGLAAIFAQVQNERVIRIKSEGVVIHPRTIEPAVARIPGAGFLTSGIDKREQLADWLTDASNPWFAQAIVNRLWKHMMGRGLVEPVDDFRATNPATHPALLDKLAEDFVTNGYSLRHTLGLIASSAAYARTADATRQNRDDDRFYSHALRRPLAPEVLAEAITDVLGIDGNSGENSVAATGGLSQKLSLFNGPFLNARIAAEGSRLHQRLAEDRTPLEIVDEFYLVALGRYPLKQEREHWQQQLAAAADPTQFLEDFVWGLLVSQEFTTNH